MANATSFQLIFAPCFAEPDIHAMSKGFNVGSYDDVKKHAAVIYDRIRGIGGAVMSPPRDENILSSFLNLRVTDIRRYYDLWSARGAKFVTEPKVYATELRCYMRDPDRYLIEVGQMTMTAGLLDL
jgi:hypothetical protein